MAEPIIEKIKARVKRLHEAQVELTRAERDEEGTIKHRMAWDTLHAEKHEAGRHYVDDMAALFGYLALNGIKLD